MWMDGPENWKPTNVEVKEESKLDAQISESANRLQDDDGNIQKRKTRTCVLDHQETQTQSVHTHEAF